jgi:hypothetical protein
MPTCQSCPNPDILPLPLDTVTKKLCQATISGKEEIDTGASHMTVRIGYMTNLMILRKPARIEGDFGVFVPNVVVMVNGCARTRQ